MNKQRIEAFSDGAYAIVITLLVLDIRIPEIEPAFLGIKLIELLPQLSTYVLIFFVVGLDWHVHHLVLAQIKKINGISSKARPLSSQQRTQQSVQPTCGILWHLAMQASPGILLASSFYCSRTFSTPAHTPLTQTAGRLVYRTAQKDD